MSEKIGKYIYCVISAGGAEIVGTGMAGQPLQTITCRNIAAVVSDAPIARYRTSRDNLMCHETAIEEAMKTHCVLPVKFATVAENEPKVKNILEREYAKFQDMLVKMKNQKELGIKAVFLDDRIYPYLLEKHEDIRALKATIMGKPPEKTHFQRMKIGEMVENALLQEVGICRDDIVNLLSPLSNDTKLNRTFGEKMIINAAFLVDKEKIPQFDRKVEDIDAKYGEMVKLKYVGEVPPFNFVNLTIQV